MKFLAEVLVTNILSFFLMLAGEGTASGGVYNIERSLTPLGWAVIIIISINLILGAIYLIGKILKKTKLK